MVLNRVCRVVDIQPVSVPRLLPTTPCRATLPAAFKRLEPGLNHRQPAEVKDRQWWGSVRSLGREVGTLPPADPEPSRSRRRRGRDAEEGQAALEFTGMFPLVVLLVLLVWQVGLTTAALALTGHAADEGARHAALGQDVTRALDTVPSWFARSMTVTESGADVVRVRTELPILVPGFSPAGWSFTSEVGVVDEPR